jgi:hypothetical protein
MAFNTGNKYWQLADPNKVGRNPIFSSPEILEKKAFEYFKWVDENPIISKKTTTSDKGTFVNEDTLQRPYTWEGLYIFLDIESIDGYRKKNEFFGIITRIDRIIRTQKFEGATAGIFNANIIARDLGLKDQSDITSMGKQINITPIEFTKNDSDK